MEPVNSAAGPATGADILLPGHISRYICRCAFAGLLVLYFLYFNGTDVAQVTSQWVLAIGAGYVLVLLLLGGASQRYTRSDSPYMAVLLLDLATLCLVLPADPVLGCPSMVAMILVVLDNGFRREARYFITGFVCAALVGFAAVILRDWKLGEAAMMPTLWTLIFVLFVCGYGYFLFGAVLNLRQRLGAIHQLGDASEDFIFALGVKRHSIDHGNSATRDIVDEGASVLDMFQIEPAQAQAFVREALDKGQATREWALRGQDRFIEVKAKRLADAQNLACTGRDMSLHHERAGRLLEQSRSDSLTRIPNRRALDRRLFSEWRRMLRMRKPIAVLMIDIDWFKPYNDELGHQAGDECLQRIAALLDENMQRPDDFVARYGGEEFTVILADCDRDGAQVVAQRLINLVAAQKLEHPASPLGYITISAGATSAYPVPTEDAQALLKVADEALYQAKEHGRNRVVVSPVTQS